MHVIFFLTPPGLSKAMARPFRGIGNRLSAIFPGLQYDLRLAGSALDAGEYIIASLFNAVAWALIVFILVFVLYYSRGSFTMAEFTGAFASAAALQEFTSLHTLVFIPPLAALVMLFLFFIRYPRILAGKIVEEVDKDLIYALKDLMVQINSGVSLYHAMLNVSKSGYGRISDEFGRVVQEINTGEAQDHALENMALRTESEFLRRTIWQIVTALKAGASLQGALASIMQALRQYQTQNVKAYAQELNLWILLYVMVAVAVPSLGITLLVILSTFGSMGVNQTFIIFLLLVCFISEFALIEFIKVRRPVLRV